MGRYGQQSLLRGILRVMKLSNDKTIGRNDPCPCGSGKKFKKCCMPSEGGSAEPVFVRNPKPPRPSSTAAKKPDE